MGRGSEWDGDQNGTGSTKGEGCGVVELIQFSGCIKV